MSPVPSVALRPFTTASLLAAALAWGPAWASAQETLAPAELARDGRLDLPALEHAVLERNPDLEAARQALAAARARPAQEGALADPMLEAMVAPPSLGDPGERVGYGVQLRQELPWFKLGPRGSAARFEAEAVAADLETARAELLLRTRLAYVDYAQAWQAREINRQIQLDVDLLRRAGLNRYAAGLVEETDPLRAEVALAHAEHMHMVYEREVRTAATRINALLRRDWNAPLPPPDALPPPHHATAVDSLVSVAAAGRPELEAAEARVRAARARATLARRERVPDLTLMVGYETFMDEKRFWPRVGVGLSLPLQFGRLSAARREADAMVAREQAMAQSERDRVALEVEEAFLKMDERAHQIDQFRDTFLPAGERMRGAARAGYESGKADMTMLLEAERELGEIRLMRLEALAEYHRARFELLRAVGDDTPASHAHGGER